MSNLEKAAHGAVRRQAEPLAWPDVDQLAQQIRLIDGDNKMGAASLAEALLEWLRAREQAESVVEPSFEYRAARAFNAGMGITISGHKSPTGSLDGEYEVKSVNDVVISPPAKLKYVISPEFMCWDEAMEWAAGQGMRLATVDEMRKMSLPTDLYWSGAEYSQSDAWYFDTDDGGQFNCDKVNALFAVAVAHKSAIDADNGQSMGGNPSF
jgi:hypothetical protein